MPSGLDQNSTPSVTTSRRSFTAGTLLALPAFGLMRSDAAAQDAKKQHTFAAAWPYSAPPEGHLNSFVSGSILMPTNIYGDMIFLPMAFYTWKSAEWIPMMATNWGFIAKDSNGLGETPDDHSNLVGVGLVETNASIFQVKLRKGVTWSDDSSFKAEDVLTTFTIARLLGDLVWQYLDRIEAVDDYTVNFVMKQPATVVQRYVIRRSPRPTSVYGDWAKKISDLVATDPGLESDPARQLLDEFNKFRPERVVASGPFIYDLGNVTEAEMTLTKNEKAWNADQVKFDVIKNYNGGLEPISALVLAKEVDYATQPFSQPVERAILESGQRIVRPPIYFGPGIIFNYGKFPQLLDKRVRQAFACIIDRAQNGAVSLGESGVPVEYLTGMSDKTLRTWLNDTDLAELNRYETNVDTASALLLDAGWTQSGNAWTMPDGSPAKFEMMLPTGNPDFEAAGEDAAEQLSAFGIEVISRGVDATQQSVEVDAGRFDFAIVTWGNSSNPHPHFAYTQALLVHNTSVASQGGGMKFPLVQETESVGKVDLEKLTFDSADGLDESAQRDKVVTLARAFNELLPILPLWERYGNNVALEGVRVEAWPPDDDPIYQNSVYADGIVTILMLQGKIGPVNS